MTHLGERVADFVFDELSPAEMDEARRHIEACVDCRTKVSEFDRTRALLRMSPDVEPPHRIVFEIEKRRPRNVWRWVASAGLAAAIMLTVLIAASPHIQVNKSQVSIVFGTPPAPERPVEPAAVQSAAAEPVDYDQILKQIEKKLEPELDKRDAEQLKKIRRLQDEWVYVEAQKRAFELSAIPVIRDSSGQE